MAEVHDGPARVVLTASIARRYYLDGRSKVEIAEEFGLNRFKVARLLDAARESGLVRIEIRHPGQIDVDTSARLRSCSRRSSRPRTCWGSRGPARSAPWRGRCPRCPGRPSSSSPAPCPC